MTILTFPTLDLNPTQINAYPLGNTRIFPSPNERFQQRVRLGSAKWRMSLQYDLLSETDVRKLRSFLAGLEGAWQTFYVGPYMLGLSRLGAGGGTPLVDGASQTGSTLNVKGFPAMTRVLEIGDYLSVTIDSRRNLYEVKAAVDSDSTGDAAVEIAPRLRGSPADEAAVDISTPTCIMALVQDDYGGVPLRGPNVFGSAALELFEADWDS